MSGTAIELELDLHKELKEIQRRLGKFRGDAPKTLVRAVNTAARSVRKQIVADAKGEYALSDKGLLKLNNAAKIRGAKLSDLTATLTSRGAMNDLMKFMVSPRTLSRGSDRPDAYAAKVLSSSGMKALNRRPKPFVTQFSNGHVAIVRRIPGVRMKGDPKREAIEKLLSPAVPHMLQDPEIQAQAQTLFWDALPASIERAVQQTLKRRGGT